jgi:hypothetical protein
MTLKQLLGLIHVVVDNSGVSGTVENFMAVVSSKVMHTLVDSLVESEHPLQI